MNLSIVRICLFVFALLPAMTGYAQTTSGSIAGVVNDPDGAAIGGAMVKITDEAKAFALSATTDGEGRFVFPQMPPGTYKLTVEASGFKKLERTGINELAPRRFRPAGE